MASKPPYISSIAEVTIWSRCYSQDPSSDLEYILSTFNVGLEENSLCDRAALTPILCAFSINKNETISPVCIGKCSGTRTNLLFMSGWCYTRDSL